MPNPVTAVSLTEGGMTMPAKKATQGATNTKETSASKAGNDIAFTYNRYKRYQGKQYTGMTIGRTHHWHYDKADWKEKKMTPDKWEFTYNTTKRRVGRAPEGSGVPVGTAYHWFILAHQFVEKENANDYLTQMVGLKMKLAHRRATGHKWSASDEKRRKDLIQILKDLIADLEREPEQITPVNIHFEHDGKTYVGTGVPILTSCEEGQCRHFDITLNKQHIGVLRQVDSKWKMSEIKSQSLTNAIGSQIEDWHAGNGHR
jgi:hypothetical protein